MLFMRDNLLTAKEMVMENKHGFLVNMRATYTKVTGRWIKCMARVSINSLVVSSMLVSARIISSKALAQRLSLMVISMKVTGG